MTPDNERASALALKLTRILYDSEPDNPGVAMLAAIRSAACMAAVFECPLELFVASCAHAYRAAKDESERQDNES
ncbi:MAG TPA: hypothetical protein VK607_10580 [Kofleriaceae bacterium]|nr:hypothetical protein [Kofleriaceae bacterium]